VPDRLLQKQEALAVARINTKCQLEEEKMQVGQESPQQSLWLWDTSIHQLQHMI
jgi:hypothetical protein